MKRFFVFISALALLALAGCHNIFQSSSDTYASKPEAAHSSSMPSRSYNRRSVHPTPARSGGSEANAQGANPPNNPGNGNDHAQVGKTTCYAHNGEPGGGVWRSTSHDQGTARGHAMQKCKAGSRTPSACTITRCVRS